eukprot:2066239-Pleurochrysis_carterae.AAC.1
MGSCLSPDRNRCAESARVDAPCGARGGVRRHPVRGCCCRSCRSQRSSQASAPTHPPRTP